MFYINSMKRLTYVILTRKYIKCTTHEKQTQTHHLVIYYINTVLKGSIGFQGLLALSTMINDYPQNRSHL